MDELENKEIDHGISPKVKKSKKRVKVPENDFDFVDINNCLDEDVIPKKKKKKKKNKKEDDGTDENVKSQREEHELSSKYVSEYDEEYKEKNKKIKTKEKKSSKFSDSSCKDKESKCIEIQSHETSSNVEVKKKKKKKKDIEQEEIDTDISEIKSSTESKCRLKLDEKKITSDTSHNHSTNVPTELDNNVRIHEEDTRDEVTRELKKLKKKKRKNREEEINNEESNNCTQTSTEKVNNKDKVEPVTGISIENSLNNKSDSDSDSDFELDEDSRLNPRIRKPKVDPLELRATKIIENQDDDCPTLTEKNIMKLASICITLTHDVPPQHDIERLAGTRVPTKAEKEEISKHITIKKGLFSNKEDKKIIRNWRKFCKKHDWDMNSIEPFLHVKRKGFFYVRAVKERRKFVQFLAKGLYDRTLYSVYHRFRNIYSTHRNDRYTVEEDDEILRSVRKNLKQGEKPNYAILAKKLNRTRASVWRRYILLKKKENADSADDSCSSYSIYN